MICHATNANNPESISVRAGFLARLKADRSGNTMAMVAAGLAPLLALIGGGVDIGRGYLAQNRLQQACDAGVLAARKKLGSQLVVTQVPEEVTQIGNRFFNANYRDGSYGSEDRDFEMTLEEDNSISGIATAVVPTTVMQLFGEEQVDVAVECEARLSFSNTDIMIALDTTASMRELVPDTSETRIDAARRVIRNFYDEIEGNKSAGTRIRYGFVPYASNVNVGGLLKSRWFADRHSYRSRRAVDTGTTEEVSFTERSHSDFGGSRNSVDLGVMDSCPANTLVWETTLVSVENEGTPQERRTYRYSVTGRSHECIPADSRYKVTAVDHTDYHYNVTFWTETETRPVFNWVYDAIEYDVSSFKNSNPDFAPSGGSIAPLAGPIGPSGPTPVTAYYRGCIEEVQTAQVDDYSAVPADAFDLNIDHIPDESNPDTLWKPSLYELIWMPKADGNGNGIFEIDPTPTRNDYWHPFWPAAVCPTYARDLDEMAPADLDQYLNDIYVEGSTHHDIGMLWAARLLSPTGIKADLNGDVDGVATSRHLIFLTDGLTWVSPEHYGAYGAEPLDQRRCSTAECTRENMSAMVEQRFSHICEQTKNKNITVWIVGFGVELPEFMKQCAGPGRWFEAQEASRLEESFSAIAKSIGDLRVSR